MSHIYNYNSPTGDKAVILEHIDHFDDLGFYLMKNYIQRAYGLWVHNACSSLSVKPYV